MLPEVPGLEQVRKEMRLPIDACFENSPHTLPTSHSLEPHAAEMEQRSISAADCLVALAVRAVNKYLWNVVPHCGTSLDFTLGCAGPWRPWFVQTTALPHIGRQWGIGGHSVLHSTVRTGWFFWAGRTFRWATCNLAGGPLILRGGHESQLLRDFRGGADQRILEKSSSFRSHPVLEHR